MKKQEIIEKLNKHNNFHLSLNVVLITDDTLIDCINEKLNFNKINSIAIKNESEAYELLKKAYNEKIKVVLANQTISFVLPKLCIITNDNYNVIKPYIKTYYTNKDNKVTSKIQTQCRKKNSAFAYVERENIYDLIVNAL